MKTERIKPEKNWGVRYIFVILGIVTLILPQGLAQAATYYCDPVSGNTQTGDGSAENPWGTLMSVMMAGKFNGTIIKSGDTVKLRTGFHGGFGNYTYNPSPFVAKNTDYITIEADTGAVADVNFLRFTNSAYWHFKGLRISPSFSNQATKEERANAPGQSIIYTNGCDHITIEDCDIFTLPDSSSWTADDWNDIAYDGISAPYDSYWTIHGNFIHNVYNGIKIYGSEVNPVTNNLIEQNTIDGFCEDGIKIASTSYCTIQDNRILNTYRDDNLTKHSDMLQAFLTNSNLIIRRNYMCARTDPNRDPNSVGNVPGYPQGMFLGDVLTNILIENNVVMSLNAAWGIALRDVSTNVKIINNTVMMPYGFSSGGNNGWPDIDIVSGSANIEIRNNVADKVSISNVETTGDDVNNIDVDHNKKITDYDPSVEFVDYYNGDVHLAANSHFVDAGSSLDAPNGDLKRTSRPQGQGYDIGAYEYVPAQKTNQISQFDIITWTFDKEYEYGQFANGDYWVVGPVTIIGITPASAADVNGRIMNGSMVNPSPALGRRQGYDSQIYTSLYTTPQDYDPLLNAARPNGQDLSANNPLILQPNYSLVSTISLTVPNNNGVSIKGASILTVLNSAAPEGSFRPPYSGKDKTIRFNKNQLNYSLLSNLTPVASTPRLKQQPGDTQIGLYGDLSKTSIERLFERPWIDHIPNWLCRCLHPTDNMPDYGLDISNQTGAAGLMLNLNYTNEQKETLLIRFVQLGIDNYGVVQDGGRNTWPASGGHESGRKLPILFAGLMLNDANMTNIGGKSGDYIGNGGHKGGSEPSDYVHFGEDDQTFYVSQYNIDITHGGTWSPIMSNGLKEAYEIVDINLPEWGIDAPTRDNKAWSASYRRCCTAYGWAGTVLTAHIMEESASLKSLWNHNALFDYQDRYMEVETTGLRQESAFVEDMWDTYRANYGCVWTRDDPTDIYSNGHYVNCQTTILYGDVSGDAEISAYDAALIAQAAVSLISLTSDQTMAADVSGEGEVSAYDAALIAQRAVGLIDKFPVEK